MYNIIKFFNEFNIKLFESSIEKILFLFIWFEKKIFIIFFNSRKYLFFLYSSSTHFNIILIAGNWFE